MRKAVSLDGEGHLVMRTLKKGDRYIDGMRPHTGQVRARIRLLRRSGQAPEAAWSLVGVLALQRQRREDR